MCPLPSLKTYRFFQDANRYLKTNEEIVFRQKEKPTKEGKQDDEDDDGFVYATDKKRAESEKNAKAARDAYKPATKESLSRLAEAGNRELNIRHSKLFEKLTKKWTK